ncbi:P-loop containing nucleoside triphosphate hydrolase protein [Paramyrothecium foliicola]|nr:P-loop containing nucleoside triphosphate hydrolase protein [Paramyrothecium foliicola]
MASIDSEIGSRCEFRTYHATPKKDGEMVTKRIQDAFGKFTVTDTDSPFALVIKRTYELENPSVPKSVTLKINSPHLLRAFREVIKSYTTVASDFTTPFQLSSPFQMLMHYWDDLDALRNQTDNVDMRMHLNLLFEFMEHEIGPDREEILAMLRKSQITYLTAWVLFRPGDILLTKVMGKTWLLRCHKTAYEESTKVGPYLEVHCTYTDHDGILKGQATKKFVIYQKRQFGGDSPAVITDLPIFPRQFAEVGDELEEELQRRGTKFLDLTDMSVQAYSGHAQYLKLPPWSWFDPDMALFDDVWLPYTESGRVVLDRKTFQNDHYNSQVPIKKVDQLEPLLCPPFAMGFSLSRKSWSRFFIDSISPVQWKQDAWSSLILGADQKLVLKALVSSHRFPDNARDQPEQKGKGLVILLHGAPGSGKTLTAEVAAEETGRALISASLGDLNKEDIPWLFETELKKLLQYATLWKAVVLLDEADVFLEARDEKSGDAKRNALVAVFLKELEYFSGVVFLTTNRLRAFDKAMKSRIHLALGYNSPDIETRRKIWIQYLQQVPADETDIVDVDDAVDFVIRQVLNGREIAGAIHTALTIARYEGRKLQVGHLEKVLEVRAAFDHTLNEQARKMTGTSSIEASRVPYNLLRQNSILEDPEEM